MRPRIPHEFDRRGGLGPCMFAELKKTVLKTGVFRGNEESRTPVFNTVAVFCGSTYPGSAGLGLCWRPGGRPRGGEPGGRTGGENDCHLERVDFGQFRPRQGRRHRERLRQAGLDHEKVVPASLWLRQPARRPRHTVHYEAIMFDRDDIHWYGLGQIAVLCRSSRS
jgi:hypothetical protein